MFPVFPNNGYPVLSRTNGISHHGTDHRLIPGNPYFAMRRIQDAMELIAVIIQLNIPVERYQNGMGAVCFILKLLGKIYRQITVCHNNPVGCIIPGPIHMETIIIPAYIQLVTILPSAVLIVIITDNLVTLLPLISGAI